MISLISSNSVSISLPNAGHKWLTDLPLAVSEVTALAKDHRTSKPYDIARPLHAFVRPFATFGGLNTKLVLYAVRLPEVKPRGTC